MFDDKFNILITKWIRNFIMHAYNYIIVWVYSTPYSYYMNTRVSVGCWGDDPD